MSEALLAEYETVLMRPALRKLHGLTAAEVETLLTDIAQHAIVLAPARGSPAPDPGDQGLWDLLAARPDLWLVTGDKALQRDAAVEAYLSASKELGSDPEKPASGKLMLRIAPELHAAALKAAARSGTSLNKWAEGALGKAANKPTTRAMVRREAS